MSGDIKSHETATDTCTGYRRTALVIWPDSSHFDIMHGADGFKYACEKIRTTTSAAPTAEESDLADYILRNTLASNHGDAIKSVCFAACIWQDLSLWVRAVKAGDAERGIAILGEDNINKALSTFGFEDLCPVYVNSLFDCFSLG